jgi:phage terminase large subunit-like protein
LPQDPGSAGKSQKFKLAGRLAGLHFSFSPETGEKADRAIPLASMWNAGLVRLVRGPWNSAYRGNAQLPKRGLQGPDRRQLARLYRIAR